MTTVRTMTDKPILFSAPMVKALLDGTKTQTRRLMPGQEYLQQAYSPQVHGTKIYNYAHEEVISAARYQVGDRLWVKEACWLYGYWEEAGKTKTGKTKRHFALLGQEVRYEKPDLISYWGGNEGFSYRTGMFMPRRYSRLTLTVTDVRVQRLMNISEKDAVAEGVADRGAYIELWKTLHGPTSWVENPWIVAVSFTVDKRNIDQIT